MASRACRASAQPTTLTSRPLLHGLTDEDVTGRHQPDRADAIAQLIIDGDPEAALAAFDALEASYRRIHDVERDRVASVLTQVYRAWGPDVLEQSIRFAGEQTLLGWMPHDVARPAEVRVRQWAAMQKGNFADITVTETDDAFVITVHLCGTCGRQVSDGCYGDTLDLAVVAEGPSPHLRPRTGAHLPHPRGGDALLGADGAHRGAVAGDPVPSGHGRGALSDNAVQRPGGHATRGLRVRDPPDQRKRIAETINLERMTGLEPATYTLARCRSPN